MKADDPRIDDEVIRERIRALIEQEKDRRGTGGTIDKALRHPITTLTWGFILTGVVGVWVTTCFQSAADNKRHAAELRELRRAAAVAVIDTVGGFLNRTYNTFAGFWDALDLLDRQRNAQLPDTVAAVNTVAVRFEEFSSAAEELESREFLDAARVCVYFGEDNRAQHEALAHSFRYLAAQLNALREGHGAVSIADIRESLFNLRDELSRFTIGLGVALSSDDLQSETGQCLR